MIRKLPFLHCFLNKSTQESGRSMVEILGVLAVMGVLSAGGIYGYSFAMDKYRANDIVYEVNLRANDVWHKYQEMPLPEPSEDGTDFDEFPDMTGTGYPIYMTSHPDVAFKTYVEGVSSRVCKNVVNMNLNGVIQGIRYVQVAQGDGDLVKYTGDASICGEEETDDTIVFTSFLDSDGRNGTSGQSGDPCVEDTDCMSACGNATCDIDELVCKNSCTGTDTPYCLDDSEGGICVECLVNDDCKSKGRGYICNETNYECTTMLKSCPDGTFRSQNGACISCEDGNNFFVLKDGQGFPDTSDEVDGYTMCQQCADSGHERQYGALVDDENRAYCSFMCTAGYSFQSESNGCIPCSSDEVYKVADAVARSQCLACGNREWYNEFCQKRLNCASDEFYRHNGSTQFECSKCSDNRNKSLDMWASWTSMGDLTYTCDNCPSTAPRYSVRNGSYCLPVCEQPPEGSEGDTICKTDPRSPLCQRKWQNSNGNCLACNVETTKNQLPIQGTIPQEMHDLCTACGRKVISDKCVLEKNKTDCKTGQFLGKDGICYNCDGKDGAVIASDEISGCTARCSKNENGEYDENGTIKTREVFVSQQWGTLCRPICPNNTLYYLNQHTTGYCASCTDRITEGYFEIDKNSYSDCEDRCPNRVLYSGVGIFCSAKQCPNKYYKTRTGQCVPCSRGNNGDDDDQSGSVSNWHQSSSVEGRALCNACGNRMVYNRGTSWWNNVCFLVDPGNAGVCNSLWSHTFPSDMNDDIIKKAKPYLDGEHDGEKFLSTDGYCYACSDPITRNALKVECAMCKNRRWQQSSGTNGTCSKGLCDTGYFLSETSCLACSNVNKPIDPSRENLCSSCSNRRQLEIGTPETTWSGLCVEECAGLQWQDINGNCLSCSEGGDRQIGTDAESRRLCNECDGLRESQPIYGGTEGAEVIGYKCVLK